MDCSVFITLISVSSENVKNKAKEKMLAQKKLSNMDCSVQKEQFEEEFEDDIEIKINQYNKAKEAHNTAIKDALPIMLMMVDALPFLETKMIFDAKALLSATKKEKEITEINQQIRYEAYKRAELRVEAVEKEKKELVNYMYALNEDDFDEDVLNKISERYTKCEDIRITKLNYLTEADTKYATAKEAYAVAEEKVYNALMLEAIKRYFCSG